MKRWNGWGNTETTYHVPGPALDYLKEKLGSLASLPDAAKEAILPSVPRSRLPAHPLVQTDAETRLLHACGQSQSDWINLRSGRLPAFPDGVAKPASEEQVGELIHFARRHHVHLIPYGGGTSVVGHINPQPGGTPVLTVSMERMTRLLDLDESSRVAHFEAGVAGPEIERVLGQHGYTLGHYPQSHEYSTLGGWIATRSSGQQSYYYGRIEALFAGGRVLTPAGVLDLPHFPASAAGPDLKEIVLGSEGRLGIITQARVRVRPVPQAEAFYGVFFPTWEQGVHAVKTIAQNGLGVSMLRLSNPTETETTLILSGKSWVGLADRGLRLIGYGGQRCLLIFGITGTRLQLRRTLADVLAICARHRGLYTGTIVGHTWKKSRFLSPYLRNTLWECGVTIDTLETALPWSQVEAAAQAIPQSIVQASQARGEPVLAFAHLSHLYRDGASIYTTYLFRRGTDPDELLARWQAIKAAASRVIQAHGGTITHQHGVGEDHLPYLEAEKSPAGMAAIRAACQTFDPDGMLNPGKLF